MNSLSHSSPQQPRDGQQAIQGIPWLARMIDKARLEAAGQIEPFDLEYPCPMDQRLLGQLGVSAEIFQQIAVESQDDDTVVQKLQAAGVQF